MLVSPRSAVTQTLYKLHQLQSELCAAKTLEHRSLVCILYSHFSLYAPGWKLLTQIYFLPDIVTFTVIFFLFFYPFIFVIIFLYNSYLTSYTCCSDHFVFFWSRLQMFLYQLICCSLPRPPRPPPLWWKGSVPLTQVKVIFCKMVMMMMMMKPLKP